MSQEPVILNLDDVIADEMRQIADIEHSLQERRQRLAYLEELRSAELKKREAVTPQNGRNPAYAPRGEITGRQGAKAFLAEHIGAFQPLADVHRGALERGAQITYGALHAIMAKDAKKRDGDFIRGPGRGTFGLREWF